jgi:hypothetical protein
VEDLFARIAENLVGRLHGPLTFRLLLQPIMATLYALRDGWKDARAGKPPYFWALFTDPAHRRAMVRDGWKSVGKVFILAVLIDAVYQVIALRFFYPFEALVVAIALALVPYILIRGPLNRILHRWAREE